ncbi:MAG: hypothetical protein J6M58_05110 [Clostridium sp.]|nr:hypothetical protein [Clostridium sp.]
MGTSVRKKPGNAPHSPVFLSLFYCGAAPGWTGVLFSPHTSQSPSFAPSWNVFPEVFLPVLQALHSNVFAVREKGCIFLRFHVTALNAVTDRIKKYILKQISSIMKADFHPGSR